MGKLWMPMSNFKKIHEDDKKAVLQHPDGHQITLAKNILSDHMKGQLASLPLHKSKGGRVQKFADGGQASLMDQDDPEAAAQMQTQGNVDPALQNAMMGGADSDNSPQGMASRLLSPATPPQGQGPSNPQIPQMQQQQGQSAMGPMSMFGSGNPTALMSRGMNAEMQGYKTQMGADQQMGTAQAGAMGNMARNVQQDLDNVHNGFTAPNGQKVIGTHQLLQEISSLKADYLSGSINPNHWMESGSLPKIATAIGLIGAMSNSKGAGEQVLNFVNQQMDRDVKSQMFDKNKQFNALTANIQLLGSLQEGLTATRAGRLAIGSAQFDQAAAAAKSPAAKAAFQQQSGLLFQKAAKMIYESRVAAVLGQPVGAGVPGNPGATGQGGANGQGTTDAMGNPLPAGLNANPAYFKDHNPAAIAGGGIGFSPTPGAADKVRAATETQGSLDSAIARVKQAWGTGVAVNPFGADMAAKKGAVQNLHDRIRELGGTGRLTPDQQESLRQLGDIPFNPINRSVNNQRLSDIANYNNDQMDSAYKANLNKYDPPVRPKNAGKFTQ